MGSGTGGDPLMGAWVEIGADMAPLDAELGKLPARVARGLKATEQTIRAQMARNRLALKDITSDKGGAVPMDDQTQAAIAKLVQKQAALATGLGKMEAAKARDAGVTERASDATQRYAAAMGHASVGQEKVGRTGRSAGMGLLLLSQAIEDAQYGFRAIVNNIPGVVMAFGGGPGLAGAVSILAVGVNQLVEHWGELRDVFGKDTEIGKAIRQIDELAKALGLASDESAKLKKAEAERAKDTEAVAGVGAAGSSERGGGIRDAVESVGGGTRAVDILMAKLAKVGMKFDEKTLTRQRGDFASLLAGAMKGDEDSVRRLHTAAKGTRLDAAMDEHSPEAKAAAERAAKERADADAEGDRLRQIEEERRERLRKRGADVADQMGPRLTLDLLDKKTDVAGEKRMIQGRLQRSGEKAGDAEAIADAAVRQAVTKLEEVLRERVLSGASADRNAAIKDVGRESRIKEGQEIDARKMKLKEELGQNLKPSIMGISEYLEKLQTGGSQDNAAVKAAQEANAKLDKIVENTAQIGKLKQARYGRKGA